ncbi:uncharacterized protein [Temnothorax longispinosus]|uniref:uncharacterized protein n=1 Tax=Temnothorax longispinosus TaxID=300112 RepID=UPI003A9954BA
MHLGTLPFLRCLDLSKNHIGFCHEYGWLWIKQAEITNALRDLDMSNNLITHLPYDIGQLNALEKLNISHNRLSNLPQSIGNIKTLNFLNVSNNRVGDLPMHLGTLPFLRCLDLSKNHIGLCHGYGWLWIKQAEITNALRDLDMSNNSITHLPYYIGQLNALEKLNISHNRLSNLPHSIENMKNLDFLNVSHNSLLYLPKEIFSMRVIDISMNPCITERYCKSEAVVSLSLEEMSVAVIQRHGIQYRRSLPILQTEYIDSNIRRCALCKQYCRVCYVRTVESRQLRYLFSTTAIANTSTNMDTKLISVEYIKCFPNCI